VKFWGAAAVLLTLAGTAQAQSPESLALLRKMQEATHRLSYTGTFVYQHGSRSETSRITRYAGGDVERLEVLDGVPRELIRTRDTVRCYLPNSKVVKVERRTAERTFPTLLPDQVGALAAHYDISLGDTQRVGGFECRTVLLKPKDKLRYGYHLYADAKTGMLVRAVTLDPAGQVVEQFTFTQLSFGRVTPDMVKARSPAATWRVEDAAAAPARLAGWGLSAELPGFHKIVELKRVMGESRPVGQMVFSDGLAAVSVFIEPLDARSSAAASFGLASMGALHFYTREVANHKVTVVGEAPAASVQRIANAVEYRRP
jgi:sigma-E factor negative regulatory protein RseB